jgi:hypothetical protein
MSDLTISRDGHADSFADKMDGVVKKAGSVVGLRKSDATSPVPDNVVDAPVVDKRKRPDKHSMDYMVRSGIAGGLAGCAVRILQYSYTGISKHRLLPVAGESHSCTN